MNISTSYRKPQSKIQSSKVSQTPTPEDSREFSALDAFAGSVSSVLSAPRTLVAPLIAKTGKPKDVRDNQVREWTFLSTLGAVAGGVAAFSLSSDPSQLASNLIMGAGIGFGATGLAVGAGMGLTGRGLFDYEGISEAKGKAYQASGGSTLSTLAAGYKQAASEGYDFGVSARRNPIETAKDLFSARRQSKFHKASIAELMEMDLQPSDLAGSEHLLQAVNTAAANVTNSTREALASANAVVADTQAFAAGAGHEAILETQNFADRAGAEAISESQRVVGYVNQAADLALSGADEVVANTRSIAREVGIDAIAGSHDAVHKVKVATRETLASANAVVADTQAFAAGAGHEAILETQNFADRAGAEAISESQRVVGYVNQAADLALSGADEVVAASQSFAQNLA